MKTRPSRRTAREGCMSESGVGQRGRAPAVPGAMLALAGVAIMAGWVLHQQAIVRIVPGFVVVFSTAFGFAVTGVALVAGALAPALRKPVHSGAGLVLAALGL